MVGPTALANGPGAPSTNASFTHSRIPEIRIHSPSDQGSDDGSNGMFDAGASTSRNHKFDNSMADSIAHRTRNRRGSASEDWLEEDEFSEGLDIGGSTNKKNRPVNGSNPEFVPWENTFNMRTINLSHFPMASLNNHRQTYRSQSVSMHRVRNGCISSTVKSLNVLRESLQNFINAEISAVIDRYVDRYFKPAVQNLRQNNGSNSVTEQHVQSICQRILDEAKKMYSNSGTLTRSNSPVAFSDKLEDSDMENNPFSSPPSSQQNKRMKTNHNSNQNLTNGRDSESETESTNTLRVGNGKKRKRNVTAHPRSSSPSSHNHGRSTPVKLRQQIDSSSWNPDRLTTDTRFVLGSKANKALGFAAMRGRLYIKHPELFRYIGDAEDKQWLHERGLMPPAGGKAFLLIKEDIEKLINSDEYRNAPGVNASCMGSGFTVPEFMLEKMRNLMRAARNGHSQPDDDASSSKSTASPSTNKGKKTTHECRIRGNGIGILITAANDIASGSRSQSPSDQQSNRNTSNDEEPDSSIGACGKDDFPDIDTQDTVLENYHQDMGINEQSNKFDDQNSEGIPDLLSSPSTAALINELI